MIGLIWAESTNRVIGAGGQIPWHLPADLTHFKQVTAGATVIMGRRTWESLPASVRPLPGRRNIIVTAQPDYDATGAETAGSVDEALALAAPGDVWVIGGQRMYEETIGRADRLEVTQLRGTFDGDTFAPEIGPGFRSPRPDRWIPGPTPDLDHRFFTYSRCGSKG